MFFMGIDVSKDKLDVCLLADETRPTAIFDNTKDGWKSLRNWLKKRAKKQSGHICLEATGRYGDGVTMFLHEAGYIVSVVNPNMIKQFGGSQLTRNKTDQIDALLIAEFCQERHQKLTVWIPPSPQQTRLTQLSRHLEDLEKMRQQEKNRLASGSHEPDVQRRLTEHIAFIEAQINEVKQTIDEHIDQHPDLREKRDLMVSIKGIGKLTAAKLLAEIRNIADFDSPNQLVAFAGLNPKQRKSGKSVRGKSRLSKMGHASIRAALYMPAISAKNFNPIMQPLVERLTQRGHCKMSIIGAVMRKLLHLVYGILKSGQPFDPNYLKKQAIYA